MVLQGVSGKTNTLHDRQGQLGLLQALAHTPSVDVTVTLYLGTNSPCSYPFVYISVLCINFCSFTSCLSVAHAFVL